MAVIAPTRTDRQGSTHEHKWANMAQSDTATPVSIPGAADRTVQVVGTFGAGGAIALQGSLVDNGGSPSADANDWFPLTDIQGNAISFTAVSQGEMITENVLYTRPVLSGGDGTTDLTVIILSRNT